MSAKLTRMLYYTNSNVNNVITLNITIFYVNFVYSGRILSLNNRNYLCVSKFSYKT